MQALIDDAGRGATVVLPAGSHPGGLVIDKPLTITGSAQAWVDADCRTDYGIEIEADGVVIQDLGVKNALESNVLIGEVVDVQLEGLTLLEWNCADIDSQSNAGIACWYCSRMRVLNSTLTTSRVFGNGIWVKSTSDKSTLGGHVISGNRITGGFDGIGSEAEDDPMGGFVRDTVISNNEVTGCHDDGIQVEGRNEGITVRANVIRGCGIGIALAPNLVGPLLIEENVMVDMEPGYYDQQACFKVGDGGAGKAELRRNVCRSEGEGLKQTNAGMSPISLDGNCFTVTSTPTT